MIESCYFTNLRTQTWQFNTNDCPLTKFNTQNGTRMTDRPKMQEAGDWQSFNYLDHQMITMEGDLIRDTTEAYITARSQLLKLLVPPPGRQANRRWGTLYLKYYGQETVQNDCTIESFEMPLEAVNPTVGPFMINWKIFDPYWTGVISGSYYLI